MKHPYSELNHTLQNLPMQTCFEILDASKQSCYAGCPEGAYRVLKRVDFFFFVVATNVHINLFIKLAPLLVGMYCSDCLQQKQTNQNLFLSLMSRGRGPTDPYLCDVNASFDLFVKTGLNCGAILLTCCGLKCAVFKRKFHHFEAVNRKNNF